MIERTEFQIKCKVCDDGVLLPQKIYRLSGPSVAIGYILLIPSILGIGASVVLLVLATMHIFQTDQVTQEFSLAEQSCVRGLGSSLSLPQRQEICECADSNGPRGSADFSQESIESCAISTRSDFLPPQEEYASLRPSAIIFGSSFAITIGVISFVSGLLGWLLIMKKRVLQCYACGAIVNTS